jgi:hypothetical protein
MLYRPQIKTYKLFHAQRATKVVVAVLVIVVIIIISTQPVFPENLPVCVGMAKKCLIKCNPVK